MLGNSIELDWNVIRVKIGDISSIDDIKEAVSDTNIVFGSELSDDIDGIFKGAKFVNGVTNLYLQLVPLKDVCVLDYGTLDEIDRLIAKPLDLSLCPIDVIMAVCLQYPYMLGRYGGLFVPVKSHGIYALDLRKSLIKSGNIRYISTDMEGDFDSLCSSDDDDPGCLLLVKSV